MAEIKINCDYDLRESCSTDDMNEIHLQRKLLHDIDTKNFVENYFSKVRVFKDFTSLDGLSYQAHWHKEDFFIHDKWKIDELQDLKSSLNKVKSQLNNLNLREWHKHTKSTNMAAQVPYAVRKAIDGELITQAWCKFYEMCDSSCLVPMVTVIDDQALNSVHLCEAPGAFVTALNQYLKLNYPFVKWDWFATTLNPYHEKNDTSHMINDDRLIYNTLDKWVFGDDLTGNIFNVANMKNIIDETRNRFFRNVMLVTADGSFDCQSNPAEQESMVAPLLYCESIIALSILKRGGTFLLKIFTIFECETICLLYFLFTLFNRFKVYKPATSKEGNSEAYVVCLDFNPPNNLKEIMDVLISYYGSELPKKGMFSKDKVDEKFLTKLIESATFFTEHQEKVIKSNLQLFKNMTEYDRGIISNFQGKVSAEFVRRFNLRKVKYECQRVITEEQLNSTPTLNKDDKFEIGTFSDRENKSKFSLKEKLSIIMKTIKTVESEWCFEEDVFWFSFADQLSSDSECNPISGTPVVTVNSSKFCSARLLKAFYETCELIGHIDILTNEDDCSNLKIKVCDVSNKSWFTNTWIAQKDSFKEIIGTVGEMEDDSSIAIKGMPLLTQFNCGFLYLLGYAFEKVGFTDPEKYGYRFIFEGLNVKHFKQIKNNCFDSIELLNQSNPEKSVLSFISIPSLCCDPTFYGAIVKTNHIVLKDLITKKINEILKK